MKTIETIDTLITANQAAKTRTPSLDAALKNLIHAREAMADHNAQVGEMAKSQLAEIAQKQADIEALKATVEQETTDAQ